MSARAEKDRILKEKLDVMLNSLPKYYRKYVNSYNGCSVATKMTYLRYMLKFVEYLERHEDKVLKSESDFNNVLKSDINGYINYEMEEKHNGASIVNAKLSAISGFFKYLMGDRHIIYNPCESIRYIKDNKIHKITFMTKDEVNQVKDNMEYGVGSAKARAHQNKWKNRDLAILMLGCNNGIRLSALIGIDMEDIDFENNKIKLVEKGNKEKIITVNTNTMKVIKSWCADREKFMTNAAKSCNALFISNRRQRIGTRTVQELIEKYTYDLDKHISPHKMRSTYATRLLAKGASVYEVKDKLGHQSIRSTQMYAAIDEEREREVAELIDF